MTLRGINMTTLPLPANSGKRTAVAARVGRSSNLATEDPHEEWQNRLRSLEQLICELLIKNQQLRWALMEMKKLEPRENVEVPGAATHSMSPDRRKLLL
jgi:hypothetical protein